MTSTTSIPGSEPFPFSISIKNLKEIVEEFIGQHSEVFDVILYGLTVLGKEKPNDLDLMILTREKLPALKLRNLILELKEKLSRIFPRKRLDIRAMSLGGTLRPQQSCKLRHNRGRIFTYEGKAPSRADEWEGLRTL